jgi:hypothetical protein
MFAKLNKLPLLAKVLIAIVLGIGCSFVTGDGAIALVVNKIYKK